jgi:hypothetical protein
LLVSTIIISSARAAVHYVDVNSTNPVAPYTSWSTAATTLQDGANVAALNDKVVAANGVYRIGVAVAVQSLNRIVIPSSVTVTSVNGPEVTFIEGYQIPGVTNGDNSVRCAFLNGGASLIGFTVTNGATLGNPNAGGYGGGVFCSSPQCLVSNCVIIGNGAYAGGGGIYGGTANNCSLIGNGATSGGGAYGTVLNSCWLTNNHGGSGASGGGAYGGTLNNCVLTGNTARTGGGTYQSSLNNCSLIGNTATGIFSVTQGGGAYGGTLNNCLLIGNSAYYGGGASMAFLTNCTVVSNSAAFGGGVNMAPIPAGGGIAFPPANTIVYFNQASSNSPNCYAPSGGAIQRNCCTTPDFAGASDLTNAPIFVAPANGDFRLMPNSPCINAGRNFYITNKTDLDGNPRITGGTVDIGVYEFQNPSSVISYAWLENYGLPADGSADFTDPDSDGMNNWQEWITNTNPTNSLSYLHMLAPDKANNAAGVTFHWQSAGIRYLLQRSTNLAGPFTTFATNFFAGVGIATYRDATATNTGPYFYRVGVQP